MLLVRVWVRVWVRVLVLVLVLILWSGLASLKGFRIGVSRGMNEWEE